ncbi:MAG: hypothetical protein HY825_14475 [Acidobacteria bacterium]|nr:hypothetical protein [Acidobacteriota bacterium]
MGLRVCVRIVVMAAVTAVALPAAALDVAGWGQALAAPALAGISTDAGGRTLSFGHLELKLESGGLRPVVVAGRVVGAYFRGFGRLRYVSTDPVEAAAYRTNVKRASDYEVDTKGAINDTFTQALLMVSDGANVLGIEGTVPEGVALVDPTGALVEHVERFAHDEGWRYHQLFPQALVDPPARPVVVAEIVASQHDLVYVFDPLRDHDEYISVMTKSESMDACLKKRRYPEMLSHQAIDRSWLGPSPHRATLVALDLNLVNRDSLLAEVDVRETFQALAPVRVIHLALASEAYGEKGVGVVCNPYVLKSVTLEDGTALPYHHARHDLVVELPQPLAAGQRVTLRFRIEGEVLFRPSKLSYWRVLASSIVPLQHLVNQAFTYHAVVKVKPPFTPFSCGRTVRRWQEEGLECAEFREDQRIQYPAVLAGKYSTYTEARDGVTLHVSSYASPDPKACKKLANLVFGLLKFYRHYLGDYPFAELNLIEIESVGWGQAPAGIIFITREAFNPMEDFYARMFSEGINGRLAHELAHAWWGHVALHGDPHDEWLSESVAEYFSAYAVGQTWKEDAFDKAFSDWKIISKFAKDKATVFTANELAGENAWEDRYGLLYGKGPLVLHALRKEVGDNAFFTVLKSYLRSFPFQPASTRNFIDLTNFATKKDYTDFFNRYLLGTESPKS